MALRQALLTIIGGVVAMAAMYGLWYQFGPESALASPESMRQYKLSKLAAGELNSIAAQMELEVDTQGRVTGPIVDLASEQQRFDWRVMGSCLMELLTIREARRIGCLPPK